MVLMMKNHFVQLYKSIFLFILVLGLLASCSKDSDPMPDGPMVARDIINEAYGTDSRQVLDAFLPAGRSTDSTPLLIYIHGGGWIQGSKEEFLQFREAIRLSFPDYAFVAINYRLFDFNQELYTEAMSLDYEANRFIKYSSILEGNSADCATLSGMIEKLTSQICRGPAVVVLDASIATEENLKLIESKGYRYLCVIRNKIKNLHQSHHFYWIQNQTGPSG
jgi:hypothetical protein